MPIDMGHLNHLGGVVEEDVRTIRRKESTYQGSWKSREAGVFHIIARMWDRMENITEGGRKPLFDIIREQNFRSEDGDMLAIIADLRRYLALVEAQMRYEAILEKKEQYDNCIKPSPELDYDANTPNTEYVNDLHPGSVVPPDYGWLVRISVQMTYTECYQWMEEIQRFVLMQQVSPEQYKTMPHSMQALYTIVQGQPRMTRDALARRNDAITSI